MATTALEEFREKIDTIDRELVKLLNQRAKFNLEIGKIKKQVNQDVYAPGREQQIFENLSRQNLGPLSNDALHHIFQEILQEMRKVQREMRECS